MTEVRYFTVRPLSKQPRGDVKDAFRIYLSSSSLAALRLRAGDICSLQLADEPPKTAIAWTAVENIQNTVVQTSRVLQDCYGIKLGDKVSIGRVDYELQNIDEVCLTDCSELEKLKRYGDLSQSDLSHWEWSMEYPLSKCEVLAVGLVFDLELKAQRRSFTITDIRTSSCITSCTLFRFTKDTRVTIGDGVQSIVDRNAGTLHVQPSGLGGLARQIEQLNESLADFNTASRSPQMPPYYEHSRGVLLYGPKGTGKTSLLKRIAASPWRKIFDIGSSAISKTAGDGEGRIRKIIQEALSSQPSVILIDQLEFLAPKRLQPDTFSLASVLCEGLDALKAARVLVVGATRHPNDVDDALRTPHRLGIEIELHVPTVGDRAEILHAIRGPMCNVPTDEQIDLIAEKTHGYVGADLFALVQLICRKARRRHLAADAAGIDSVLSSSSSLDRALAIPEGCGDGVDTDPTVRLVIDESDVVLAMQEIRPTAMREVFLETPKVRWSDIGGQHDIKRRLQKAVQRPLKSPDRMKRLNVMSKKGFLLYGPPGCSKTLMVKALATEAGLNFLAVKGAEILSMYVGESERALREIFRKARSARPSIIFFDEIDAIASKRGNDSRGGVNVLTTLLNEMDGIEELNNVLVVAATNKPDVIDPALMRPGRLDDIIYIGPPDFEARKEIFRLWSEKSVVSSEVDLEQLAHRTDGYSGAEIVSICEIAGDATLDEEEETGQEQEIQWKHFEYALGRVRRQITDAVIQEYERWRNMVAG